MSSLASQLKSISDKTASVALDRKQRSKIHSRSILYDPKQASTQDYETIYDIALDGFEELCGIDTRFNKFKQSLFSETSITFDRNSQTPDIIQQLDSNINAFLTLVGPYYMLTPALKAVEWLIRRFYANIHNSELLLLTSLPYYQQNIFNKILSVIPKSNFPTIFHWLVNFKDNKNPPSASVLKAFYNDFHFFNFYSQFLNDQVKNHTVYKQQLILYLSNTVQVLASYSRNHDELNEKYLPVVFESVGLLLSPYLEKHTSTINHDLKLTAYSLISVLTSIVPLKEELLKSLTVSILEDKLATTSMFIKPTLIVLTQLWNTYNGRNEILDCFGNLGVEKVTPELLNELQQEGFKVQKFITLFFLSKLPNGGKHLLEFIDLENKLVYDSILTTVIEESLSDKLDVKNLLVDISQTLFKTNSHWFIEYLRSKDMSVDDLELKLQSVIGEKEEEEVQEINEDEIVELTKDEASIDFETLTSSVTSYFNIDSDDEFNTLLKTLTIELSNSAFKSQASIISLFINKVFKSLEIALSFIIRIAFTPAVPTSIRLSSIKVLKHKLKSVTGFLYLLSPIILLGLLDESKSIRSGFAQILTLLNTTEKDKSPLFMENEIYCSTKDKKLIKPADGKALLDSINEYMSDLVLDPSRINEVLFNKIFDSKKAKYYEMFILSQWALPFLPIVFKWKAWRIASSQNDNSIQTNVKSNVRYYFLETDIESYFKKRESWLKQAEIAKINFFDNFETSLVGLVGGVYHKDDEKKSLIEAEWICQGLASKSGNLQIATNNRVLSIFDKFIFPESALKITNKLVDLLVNDDIIDYDPLITLQEIPIDTELFLTILSNVQIGNTVPEQGVAKRRRRSSNSTKQAMVKNEVNNMASIHLRKLTFILDVLEYKLRRNINIARPELLKTLFKILTDLDYLGNDGNLPVLYTQETLATCMLLSIINMKNNSAGNFKFDSNSIRADLIVNSIRSSSSPQVQNKLLLVISELASLAPEIILHSVMPIFTFMGAHTIRQDDEFSDSALQQTIAKVIPALANNGSSPINNETEFLLTSFTTAFQHIPRHRRVKLFVSLTHTLKPELSMHLVLFLMGQQYSQMIEKGKSNEANSILEFIESYLKDFDAYSQLNGIFEFTNLWNLIPLHQLDSNSGDYDLLNSRSIFGTSILTLTNDELSVLKNNMLQYVKLILDSDASLDLNSLKTKIGMILLDKNVSHDKIDMILSKFREITSFILTSLDQFTNTNKNMSLCLKLYDLLNDFLNLLPLNFFVDSIIDSLDISKISDGLSIKIAKNYAILSARKFETELSQNNTDIKIDSILQILVDGIQGNIDTELQQAYLDCFATIVSKTQNDNSKLLLESMNLITTDRGLLNDHPEIIVSSISAIISIVNVLGVKTLGQFPKVIPPALTIWEKRLDDTDENKLVQGSILVLLSCYIKKIPAFMTTSLESTLITILSSDLIDISIRSNVLSLIVDHMELSQVLKAMCNVWLNKNFYRNKSSANLGLFLNYLQIVIDKIEKKQATSQSSLFMQWLISSFEFRSYCEENDMFDNNTIHRLESSFHQCAITFVMKLNDKSFRPLFANLVRWAIDGEGSNVDEVARLLSFFRFFNKLQDQLKSIITSYYSYLLDPTSVLLTRFSEDSLKATNLRRIILISLNSSFRFDQDDYWSQQGRFDSICKPLLTQLTNIEDSIGKYLIKAISSFVKNVSSEEYNEILVNGLIQYISNENSNTSSTKIWTIRSLKTIFQKMGEQWLSYLPTLVPYIAELLEDDDESVEMEVRVGLVKVIENVLGEPLDRYLS